MTLLEKAKQACRVISTAYDDELSSFIEAAFADIGIPDINAELLSEDTAPPLVVQAVLTYVRMNFGEVEDGEYARLKASYDEQKAQLLMSSDYTIW